MSHLGRGDVFLPTGGSVAPEAEPSRTDGMCSSCAEQLNGLRTPTPF